MGRGDEGCCKAAILNLCGQTAGSDAASATRRGAMLAAAAATLLPTGLMSPGAALAAGTPLSSIPFDAVRPYHFKSYY